MTSSLLLIVLLVLFTFSNSQSFNHLDKSNLFKSKYLEQRLVDISANLKELTNEITALKKISKKLVKHVTRDWTGPQKGMTISM